MARKRIGNIKDDALITTGVILVGYTLVRNLLPSIGVSDEDRQTIDDQQTTDPADNIFSSYSDPYAYWFGTTGVDIEGQFGVNSSMDMYLKAYRQFLDGDLSPDNPLYAICLIYHNLHAAVTGHIFTGDQEGALQALNLITNKWQVGAIAELWATEYGGFGTQAELFQNLKKGTWPMLYGLNPADLAAQIRRLNNLPD